MIAYHWDFGPVWRNLDVFALGGLATLKLTAFCLLLSVPIGLVVAIMRLSGNRLLTAVAVVYTEFFRTAASIVLIFWFFFAFPLLISVDLDAFWAALLAIGLQGGAYFAEVFRGAILSIVRGQWEAAKAIGMSRIATLRYIVFRKRSGELSLSCSRERLFSSKPRHWRPPLPTPMWSTRHLESHPTPTGRSRPSPSSAASSS